jgi:hypothetical protein
MILAGMVERDAMGRAARRLHLSFAVADLIVEHLMLIAKLKSQNKPALEQRKPVAYDSRRAPSVGADSSPSGLEAIFETVSA